MAVDGAGDVYVADTGNDEIRKITPTISTVTTVAAPSNPSFYGQSVTFTATVAAKLPGEETPAGSVTFIDGTATLGSSVTHWGHGHVQRLRAGRGNSRHHGHLRWRCKLPLQHFLLAERHVGPHQTAVTVTDTGGTYNGLPYPATALVNGEASLESVTPTVTYYAGSLTAEQIVSAAPLPGAPARRARTPWLPASPGARITPPPAALRQTSRSATLRPGAILWTGKGDGYLCDPVQQPAESPAVVAQQGGGYAQGGDIGPASLCHRSAG